LGRGLGAFVRRERDDVVVSVVRGQGGPRSRGAGGQKRTKRLRCRWTSVPGGLGPTVESAVEIGAGWGAGRISGGSPAGPMREPTETRARVSGVGGALFWTAWRPTAARRGTPEGPYEGLMTLYDAQKRP
jgi:hypothetical protein